MPPTSMRKRPALLIGCLLIVLASIAGFSACGGSDNNSVAEELAHQQEIVAARREAAQNARQAERVRQLTREVNRLEEKSESVTPVEDSELEPEKKTSPTNGGRDLGDWPGGSGYSAMLGAFSIEENARARQHEATERGLDAGVLFSSEFTSLRPGYWVVFSGTFDSQEQAAARATRARGLGYSDSYPRFVSP